jgi:hypothetical protein
MNRVLFIVPSRDREAQERQFCIDFPKYLERESYITDYRILLINQRDDRGFNLGWNINVGFDMFERNNSRLDYTYHEDDCVVFLPIDGCPVNLNYVEPDRLLNTNLTDVWDFYSMREANLPPEYERPTDTPFRFASTDIIRYSPVGYGRWNSRGFNGPYSATSPRFWNSYSIYYKALGLGRIAYRTINGHTNQYFGWGADDDNLLARIKHHEISSSRSHLVWSWYYGGYQSHDALQESHAERVQNSNSIELLQDGLSTLQYTAHIEPRGAHIYHATVTPH